MRNVPQRVQKKDVEILQLRKRGLWDRTMIGQISRAAEAKAINLSVAVNHRDWLEAGAEQIDRTVERLKLDLS